MDIIRIRNKKYSTVCNTCLRDSNLGLKPKGLYAIIMSLPDDWDFSINGLMSIIPDGKRSIMTSINELKAHGYCDVKREFQNGRVSKFRYVFYEEPQCENQLLHSEVIHSEVIHSATEINKDINKNLNKENISSSLHSEDYSIADATEDVLTAKELNDFVFYWNSKLPLLKISKFTEVRKQKLRVRLKEVTDSTPTDTLRLLVDNVANSSFLQGDNNRGFKGTIDWVIKNESNFTKVLEGRYNDTTKETATTSKPSPSYDSRESREAEHARLRERIQARLLGGMGTTPV